MNLVSYLKKAINNIEWLSATWVIGLSEGMAVVDKRKALVCGAIVVAVVALGVFLAGKQPNASEKVRTEESIEVVLNQAGYNGSIGDWLNELPEDQVAVVDIPFESAVKNGFTGTREDWVAQEVKAHLDSNGNLVVTLPDGGEFTYTLVKGTVPDSNATEGAEKSDDQSAASADTAGSKETTSEANGTSEKTRTSSGGTSITVGTVQAYQGEQGVAIPISIRGNPGVLGMTLSVSYDEKALTLVGAENGDAFADALSMTHSRNYASGCLFTWDGVELKAEEVKDGVILTLHFDVAPDASGLQAVAIRSGSPAFDSDLNEISLVLEDGKVIVG